MSARLPTREASGALPAEVALLFARAIACHRAGDHDQAESFYRAVLASEPRHADALTMLGTLYLQRRQPHAAVRLIQASLAISPQQAAAWTNLASALNELKDFDPALAASERAVSLQPRSPEAHNNRGIALEGLQRSSEALGSLDHALSLKPDYAKAHYNRAISLRHLGRPQEALESYARASRYNPQHAEAYHNRGSLLQELRRDDEALVDYGRALTLRPDDPHILSSWLHAKMQLCDWEGLPGAYARFLDRLSLEPVASNFSVLLAGPSSAEQQLRCAQTQASNFVVNETPLHAAQPYGHSKVRLGYFSSDLRDHPMSYLTAELFERHDRSKFEVIAFAHAPAADHPLRDRLKAGFDRFLDVSSLSDREIAYHARSLELDIAVDLNGYTLGARTGVFALRPAPVQVGYMGHAGTLGAPFIDYLIADRVVIPEGDERFYSEKIAYLPHTYWVNSAQAVSETPVSRAQMGLPETGFVFCCFNNPYKITPDVFDVWMRLLHRMPNSVLWLYAPQTQTAENLRSAASARGVSPERIVCAPKANHAEHLARHQLADLVLDTFHYNAHTTAADALWMGLPVVTLLGKTFAGRVAASLLRAIGAPELVTRSVEEYEALAMHLAANSESLAQTKARLVRNRPTCPLFDTTLFARHVEDAFLQMWQRRESGQLAEHIYVGA